MDNSELKKALHKRKHPEQQEDELFLFNVFPDKTNLNYDHRLGELNNNNMKPVFIKQSDLEEVMNRN